MKERLKKLRLFFKLSQTEFGARIGVGYTAISKIERGENGLSEQMILLICQTFNVNRAWLEHGLEPMLKTPDDDLAEAFTDILMDGTARQKAFAAALTKLSEEQFTVLEEIARHLVRSLDAANSPASSSEQE